jgi:hypothetical protein
MHTRLKYACRHKGCFSDLALLIQMTVVEKPVVIGLEIVGIEIN